MISLSKTTVATVALLGIAVVAFTLTDLVRIERRLNRQDAELARLRVAGTAAAPDAPPAIATISVSGRDGLHALGRADAPITVVEFTDLECPYCRQFHTTAFVEIKKRYIDAGVVQWITRDLPLDIHPHARKAAEAARCAGDQGKFWEMRHALLDNANPPTLELIVKTADALSLETKAFTGCLDTGKYQAAIDRDIAEATMLGVTHTPTFVVARSGTDRISGVVLLGAQPFARFQVAIDSVRK